MDDPNYWKTVKDSITGKEVVLTDEQIDMIQKLQQSCYPEESVDPYEVCDLSIYRFLSTSLSAALRGPFHCRETVIATFTCSKTQIKFYSIQMGA